MAVGDGVGDGVRRPLQGPIGDDEAQLGRGGERDLRSERAEGGVVAEIRQPGLTDAGKDGVGLDAGPGAVMSGLSGRLRGGGRVRLPEEFGLVTADSISNLELSDRNAGGARLAWLALIGPLPREETLSCSPCLEPMRPMPAPRSRHIREGRRTSAPS